MIRVSEMVLPGHPDKFCDQIADAVVEQCYAADPQAYCQVEVACWSDEIWLTGGIVTRSPLDRTLEQVVHEVGRQVGYVAGNAIDAAQYRVRDSVCQLRKDPRQWTHHVNDQCIAVGWAGYDERVGWLPPEHYLAHTFREALTKSFSSGRLAGQGPDGKLIVQVRESSDTWIVEHVLVTVQHLGETPLDDICGAVWSDLGACYRPLQQADGRWSVAWDEVEVLVNPNGPLINGGSDGDNGQTGRKLAMEYYGPRVPIGGGALCGKDLTHIDRAAAYALRQAAIHAVESGARECRLTGVWAPNKAEPLELIWDMDGRGARLPAAWFEHTAINARWDPSIIDQDLGRGRHFFDRALPWNAVPDGYA